MDSVIEQLKKWQADLQEEIKEADMPNKKSLIKTKQDIENAIFSLELCISLNIKKSTVAEVVILEEMNTGYSEYRIINDCETDNRDLWIEVDQNGPLRCSEGDVIIKRIS